MLRINIKGKINKQGTLVHITVIKDVGQCSNRRWICNKYRVSIKCRGFEARVIINIRGVYYTFYGTPCIVHYYCV